ncbi:hypothetical protein WCWAEYFT_CDS0145 [Vibrio phage VB_VaC_TDDLMA]
MKFKLFYDGIPKKIVINASWEGKNEYKGQDVLPENLNDQVIVKLPLEQEEVVIVRKYLNDLVNHKDIKEQRDEYYLNEQKIRELQLRQRELMLEMRKTINPKIYHKAKNIKKKNPELFI